MAGISPNGEYLAQPPRRCCLVGSPHDGSPRGAEENILDVPTYVVRPPDISEYSAPNGHIVLFFPDVWGLSVSAKCLMDGFASAGYTVLGMDYDRPGALRRDAETDPLPVGVDHMGWMINRWKFTTANLVGWMTAVRERFGSELQVKTGREVRYGCVGYCAGALSVCDLLAGAGGNDGEPFVAAGGFAHPAALKEEQIINIKSKWPRNHFQRHQNHAKPR